MVAFTSIFAEARLAVSPKENMFDEVSYAKGSESVALMDTFDFALDTAELAAPLQLTVKGGLDGVAFKAETVAAASPAVIRVSYIASKAGEYKDSIFVSAGALKDTVVVTLTVVEKVPVITVSADQLDFGEVKYADAAKGKSLSLDASVTEGAVLSVALDDASAFSAKLEEGKLVVTLKAGAGSYAAVATLSAPGAESKTVALSATVGAQPVITAPDKMEFGEVIFAEAPAGKKLPLEASVSDGGQVKVNMPINDHFSVAYDHTLAQYVITFTATEAGEYATTMTLKADGADNKSVALSAKVLVKPTITVADKIEFGEVDYADVLAGKALAIDATVDGGVEIAVALSGADADKFDAKIAEGKLDVTFKMDPAVAGEYSAVATLTAPAAEDKTVAISATAMPKPVITAAAESIDWGKVLLADAKAGVEKEIAASVDQKVALEVEVAGTNAENFAAEIKDGKLVIKMTAKTAGLYNAIATLKAKGAENVQVQLSAYVAMPDPVITVKPTEWKINLTKEIAGSVEAEQAIVIVSKYLIDEVYVAIQSGKNFAWDADNQKVTFQTDEIGVYKDTLVISSEGAETVKVPLSAEVAFPTPVITIKPGEWKTTIELVDGKAEAERPFSISGKRLLSDINVAIKEANSPFVWNDEEQKVTFSATKAGTYDATLVVSTEGAEPKEIALQVIVTSGGVTPQPGETLTWVTDPSTLKAGDKIIITNNDKTKAMSTAQTAVENKSYYRGETDFDENNISDEVEKIELEASGNYFKLKVTGGYLYFDDAWMTAGNQGKKQNWLGTNATGSEFKFELVGDIIYVVEVKNDGVILYNAGSTRFSHYARTSSLFTSGSLQIALLGEGGSTTPVAVTGVTLDQAAASVEAGKTITLKATVAPADASNKNITWASDNEAVATVKDGVVTGVAEGTANITVTTVDGGFTAKCVVTVTKPAPVVIEEKTIAEFIAAGGGKCYLKGVVSNIVMDKNDPTKYNKYGNFDLTDASGTIYVYGLLTAAGEAQKFQDMGVDEGDTLTVIAETYEYYQQKTHEVKNAIFVEVKKADAKATTTLTIEPKTASVEAGKTVTLKVTRDGNDALVWASSDEKIATVKDGVVTGVAEGTVKISATANNVSDTAVITVTKAPDPSEIEEKTIAEFIAAGGGKCKLTGVVSNITNTKYGNFDLTDASGTIYVYGLLTAAGEKQKFADLGVEETDTLTVIAETYEYYQQKTHEVKDAIFVSVKKGSGDVPGGDTIPELPEGVISCDSAVTLAAAIADPVEVKSTVEGEAVTVRGYVAFAYDAANGKQSAWLTDKKGSKSGVIQAAYLQVTEAVAVGDYVEAQGTLAKYLKAGKDGAANEVVIEIINGTLAKVGGVTPPPSGDALDINTVDAYIAADYGMWEIVGYQGNQYEEGTEGYDYPMLDLIIENASGTRLAGKHNIVEGVIYLTENDSIEAASGTLYVTCIEEGSATAYPYYHFTVDIVDTKGAKHTYEFEADVAAFDYDTEEEIELEDKAGEAIENVTFEIDFNAPMYNIQGMQVGRGTQGILIQNGHKFIIVQ